MNAGFPDKDDFVKLAPVSWGGYRRWQKNKNKTRRRKIFWGLTAIILAGLVFFGSLAYEAGLSFIRSKLPSVTSITDKVLPQESAFYDKDGQPLYRLSPGLKRVSVGLKEVSPHIKNALLAVEDHRFYEHKGLDSFGILRALMVNTVQGDTAQGGSTITQQLARLLYLDSSESIVRKLKEAVLAGELEKNLTKDEILELYLNAIPFGSNIYGVEAAGREFFSKSAKDLSVAEAAVLAALQKAPSRYYPYGGDTEALFGRAYLVIDLMVKYGFLSEPEKLAAAREPINFSRSNFSATPSHFATTALEDLRFSYGGQIIQEGLQVTTTLNLNLQDEIEKAVKNFIRTRGPSIGADNAAAVVLEAKTGNVLALVGSADSQNAEYGAFNAARAERQPGSTLKPFIYALAFEDKILGPSSTVRDEPVSFGNYQPQNFDRRYWGAISVRDALIQSRNVPAIRTLNATGLSRFLDRLKLCNLNLRRDAGLTVAIGGAATSLYKLAAAYTALANNGVCVPPRTLLKVMDSQGNVLLDRTELPPKFGARAFSENAVKSVNKILADTKYTFSEYASINKIRDARIKTGTSDGPRDAWVIGYTDNLVVGIWVGNHDNSLMKPNVLALSVASPLWNEVFLKAYEGTQ